MELVAVLRRPDGLVASMSRRCPEADLDALLSGEAALEDASSLYELVERPLSEVPASLCPAKGALSKAWEGLRAVRKPSPAVLGHVLTLLRETTWADEDTLDLPPLVPPSPPVPPTAAHPRAFQGTTYRPPTPKSSPVLDLRPYLCAMNSLTTLLHWLAPAQPENARAAAEEVRWEHGLPSLFRAAILPQAKSQGRAAVNALLALYWQLGLETDTALLAPVTHLLCLSGAAGIWLTLMTALPPDRRLLFADLLLETEAYAFSSDIPADWWRLIVRTAQGRRPGSRLFGLFQAWKHDTPPDYLAAGLRLDDAEKMPFGIHEIDWSEISPGAYCPAEAIAVAERHWEGAGDHWRGLSRIIWQQCGKMAGLGRVIENRNWMRYPPETSCRYLWFYLGFADHDSSPEDATAAWGIIERNASRFDALLESVPPEYHSKLLANLKDFCWNWEEAATLERCLPPMETLLRRLCRPPFRRDCDIESVTSDFLEFLAPASCERFLRAPDASFLRLEDACRRANDAWLCSLGTWSLTRHLPEWTLEAFQCHPAKLFKVCKLLGAFSHALRDQVARDFSASSVLDDAAILIPPPRLLREHQDGTRRLPDDQLAHYEDLWRRQVALRQLEALEQRTLARLGDGFPADATDEAARHALQIQFRAQENRRALRRFLKAHWTGESDYLLTHPRTQAWLKRHPWLNVPFWLEGLPYAAETEVFDAVSLSIEQDPLEILKMGTYVGSCLGLGGSFAYSAAAVALDINKQVLYARRSDGTVVARQLVALSEEKQLVCFTVYPYTVAPELQRHFSAYDRHFAKALGVTLYRDGAEDEYTIQTILAHDWWDDFAWAGNASTNGANRP